MATGLIFNKIRININLLKYIMLIKMEREVIKKMYIHICNGTNKLRHEKLQYCK